MLNTDLSFYGQQTGGADFVCGSAASFVADYFIAEVFRRSRSCIFYCFDCFGEQGLAQKYLGQIGIIGGILAGLIVAIGLWVVENGRRKTLPISPTAEWLSLKPQLRLPPIPGA